MSTFNPSNIPKIFGYEDAADENTERLKEFFFKRDDFEVMKSDLPIAIVVGFKGVGKSALLKVAYDEDIEENLPAIWIRPDDIIEMMDDLSNDIDFNKMVLLWKRGIAKLVASRIASDWMYVSGDSAKQAIEWSYENGFRQRDFIQKVVGFINPTINKKVDSSEGSKQIQTGEHRVLERLIQEKNLNLYFDDLDAGWEATDFQRKRLSALLLALRNMTSDIKGLKARLALRTDVYSLIRESDESTDKSEGYVVNCNWKNDEILLLLVKRVVTSFGTEISDEALLHKTQYDLNEMLAKVMDTKFTSTFEWRNKSTHKVITSLIRSRPRDMIKLCTLAAKHAYTRDPTTDKIKDTDFENILSEYSRNRLQDIVNEFKFELDNLEPLLYRLAPTKSEIRSKQGKLIFVYKTDELLTKIKNIMSNVNLKLKSDKITNPTSVAHFLYKIGFITARKQDSNGKIIRQYYDETKQLLKSNQIGDGGFSWEVHPAYRKAISTDNEVFLDDE